MKRKHRGSTLMDLVIGVMGLAIILGVVVPFAARLIRSHNERAAIEAADAYVQANGACLAAPVCYAPPPEDTGAYNLTLDKRDDGFDLRVEPVMHSGPFRSGDCSFYFNERGVRDYAKGPKAPTPNRDRTRTDGLLLSGTVRECQ